VLPNYNSELVKQHKAQFDAKNFTYRTIKNEYTYQIAKFIQALYPNSNLTLNQIILALGLTNYPKLYSLDQAYESEFIINLPQLTQIQTIHIAQADDYLLNHNLTESQQLSLLKQISEKFNPHLTITSANLFATKLTGEANLPPPPQFLPNASATVAAASQPAKLVKTSTVTPPPSAPRATITEQIITKISYYRYYILAIISGLMIGLISMIMRKRKQALQATTNLTWDSNLLEETQQVKSSSSIDNSTTQTISSNLTETSSQIFTQETALDQDLITTLEQILALDENREDILLKLFELHLVGQCLAKAQEYYSKLLQRWADNQLGLDKLNELCVKFNFTPNNILSTTNNNATQDILANQDYNVEQTPSPDNLLSNDLDVTMNSNVENSLDNNMPTLDDLEYEEQLNLVRMYCQIDETEQATQIINNLLANSSLSAKVHQQIDNLKQELGL
jgi:hypothetical protein